MMKFKLLKGVFFTLIFLSITINIYNPFIRIYSIEIDVTTIATNIVDGDTFDIYSGDRIRLADVDTPEHGQTGFYEALEFLSILIYNKKIYLDIDDIYVYDTYGSRFVCLVYVDFNSTHYLNVNEALLVSNLAHISNYDNEFNPYVWTLFVPKVSLNTKLRLLGISSFLSLASTLVIYLILKRVWNLVLSGLMKTTRKLPI